MDGLGCGAAGGLAPVKILAGSGENAPFPAIFYTGGMAYSDRFTQAITDYVGNLAPVLRLPGEEEMRSLAEGALRVLHGEQAKVYP